MAEDRSVENMGRPAIGAPEAGNEGRSMPGPEPARHSAPTWLAPVLLLVALTAEVLTMLLMTVVRYRSQQLEPALFDFGKTGNVIGFLFEAPFILLFAAFVAFPRFHRLRLAAFVSMAACTGLIVLSSAPTIPVSGAEPSYTIYLLFLGLKALELAILITLFRHAARPARRRPVWRRAVSVVLTTVAMVVAVLMVVVGMVLVLPISSSVTDQPRQAYDAGVILGAAVWSGDRPSPVLRERINKGYDLLRNGTVQFLVLTGGHAPNELPEAEVARRELLKQGADPTRIVIETRTSSTLEQILFIRDQLEKKQGWQSFVIISDQFHLKRALEICQFNDIAALGVSSESPLGPQNLAVYHVRESGALVLYWLFGA